MRNDASRLGNFDTFKDGIKGFIFKGTNGRWRDILSAEELVEYDAKLQSEMSQDAAAWSVNGRSFLVGAANA
jgi:aryl sulfotransferase